MRIRNVVVSAVVVGLFTFLGMGLVQAQAPPAGGAGGAGGGERPRFDPAQMRQRMMDRIKQTLEIGDKEWAVVQPKVEEVMNLSRQISGGGMFGRRGGGGGGRPGAAPETADKSAPQSDVAKAEQELRTTLENKAATPEEIKAKVTALREAREKAKKDLTASKDALRELLSPRQEAQLILMGILD